MPKTTVYFAGPLFTHGERVTFDRRTRNAPHVRRVTYTGPTLNTWWRTRSARRSLVANGRILFAANTRLGYYRHQIGGVVWGLQEAKEHRGG